MKFDGLVVAFGADLFRNAVWMCGNGALAKDSVQETCLRAWKSIDRLNEKRAAKRWSGTIVRRECARTFERDVPQLVDVDETHLPAGREFEPDDQLHVAQFRALVQLKQRMWENRDREKVCALA